jgi:hypothetical protein
MEEHYYNDVGRIGWGHSAVAGFCERDDEPSGPTDAEMCSAVAAVHRAS